MVYGAVFVTVRECSPPMRQRLPADNLEYSKLKVPASVVWPKYNYSIHTDEVAVLNASSFGDSNGPILLDEIVCTGGENSLSDCEYDVLHMCSHELDVAIICHRKYVVPANYLGNNYISSCSC